MTQHRSRVTDGIALGAVSAFAFYFSVAAGERGFFPLDQSMVFDAAYRIFSGQVPYRDFVLPYGAVPPALQALAFSLLGVSYRTYLFTAAAMNALAAVLSAATVRLLFPGARGLSYVAAMLTAVWFYPPFGTPSFQQTSFLFGLLALAPLVAAATRGGSGPNSGHGPNSERGWNDGLEWKSKRGWGSGRGSWSGAALLAAAGAAGALAILCKQNTGAYMLPGWVALLAVAGAPSWRRVAALGAEFSAGFAGTLVLFLAGVWFAADAKLFTRHFLELPATIGELRFAPGSSLLADIVLLRGPRMAARLPLAAALLVAAVSAASALRVRPYPAPGSAVHRRLLAATVCLYLVFYQQLFLHTTNNAYENGLPFVGIIVAVATGLALSMLGDGRRRRFLRAGVWLAVLASTGGLLHYGARAALERWVHDMFAGASFPHYLREPNLEHLRWGQPTAFDEYTLPEDDVVAVLRFLRADGRRFFVFPDFSLLYGILGKPAPQPLVWFQKGITYPATYDVAVDRWVVAELRRNRVEVVVIEARSWSGTWAQLEAFPLLAGYIARDFERTREFGIFKVYERTHEGVGP